MKQKIKDAVYGAVLFVILVWISTFDPLLAAYL